MAKRRILRTLKLTEISAVDRPCQEGATVSILKRAPETAFERRAQLLAAADELLAKFNENHDERGRFASGDSGGSTASNEAPASPTGTEITPEHKQTSLRWMQTAASRTVPIVFVSTIDPVGGGLVASLAKPGGNATGFRQ